MSSDEEDDNNSETESLRSESTFQSEKTSSEMKPDRHIYNAISYRVHKDYSCRLERQDEDRNRNKFYLLQVLEKNKRFFVYSRWGKKGHGGQQRMSAPFENANEAVVMFEKRFKEKTGLDWGARDRLNEYKGMYVLYRDDKSLQSFAKQQQKQHDYLSKQFHEENDPIEKSAILLKDACFEINVVNSDKSSEIVKEFANHLNNLCPDAFNKKKPFLSTNSGIKDALTMLNDYNKKKIDISQEA